MSIIPTPPGALGGDDESMMGEGQAQASGDAEQATRPMDEAPPAEDEQLRGAGPLDPDKGAP